ncbi:hypothetical protein ACRTC7_07855 [Vibrio fluvialis]|jgi:hypothetical protein|uniref:hypothetical protein n=1 Tax=Vibrio fluvialis TaxID=676 RepID=UPI00096BB815|nr:hypothetical protein [Vibrio fluvialis]MBY8038911.1 hypothetical protein [Vibrio fluvialis]
MSNKHDEWVKGVEKRATEFANKHSATYNKKKRELSASFEIGCFHALLNYYQGVGYSISVENLVDGEYRYLTTPNGNPANFSYISLSGEDGCFELRQQVRIYSHLDGDIAFAPDIVVLFKGSEILSIKDDDYASGKRPFYTVSSKSVVAVHECKSMMPFPELLVSFIGMFVTAHGWYRDTDDCDSPLSKNGLHLAPTMFVGGTARAMHLKMIRAIERTYPVNIVVGLHQGTWNLYSDNRRLNKLSMEALSSLKPDSDKEEGDDIPF